MIRVLIADDHPLLREGLKHLLAECPDINFAGEAANGFDLVRKVREEQFDVVVLDMFMPGKSGLELIKQLKNEYPRLPVLVLSMHKEDIYALRVIKAGASGYVCKDYAASDLVDAIRRVAGGGIFVTQTVAELMARDLHEPTQQTDPHDLLSDREYQIFLLFASGKGATEIANQLNLSVKTVSTHKARIKEKMQLSNSSEFVRYALKHKLISEDGN